MDIRDGVRHGELSSEYARGSPSGSGAPAEFSDRQPMPAFGNVDEGSPGGFSDSFDFDQSPTQDWDIGA